MRMDIFSVQILDGEGVQGNESRILEILTGHARTAVSDLEIERPFNITVYPNPNWSVAETGEGGYTPTGDWAQLYLDLSGKQHSVQEVIENRLPTVTYHEINHIKRWQTVGYGSTLIEAIVSEGLASVYEVEKWKGFTAPWLTYSEEEIGVCLNLLSKHIESDAQTYDHGAWFFGSEDKIPKWCGYMLGHYIVSKAIENAKLGDSLRLVSKPADYILAQANLALGIAST